MFIVKYLGYLTFHQTVGYLNVVIIPVIFTQTQTYCEENTYEKLIIKELERATKLKHNH